MPFTRTIKIFLLMCLSWAVAFCLGACAPARLTKENVHHLQMSAHRGDAKSQVLIGEIYEFGADGPANPLIAAQWYQQAAMQDDPDAQFYLGVMYDRGDVLGRNPAESLKWLFKSGEQGQEKAQIMLALVYLKDKGLRQEFSARIRRYRQSAEKGNAIAQYTLGWIYREGVGLPANPLEALRWYQKAAQQGSTMARFALGNIYLEGKVAPVNPAEALDWYRSSAEAEIKARVKLCELYKGAGGVPGNAEEAKKCSDALAQKTDASLRSYIDMHHKIIYSEKEKHPTMAIRACQRIAEMDQTFNNVSEVCNALTKQISEKMSPLTQEAESALAKKDWDHFRELLSAHLTPVFDEGQLRRLIGSAWQRLEEETRLKEKVAQELLRPIEAAERSAAYRKNKQQIFRLISSFKTTVDQGLRDHPGDAALLALEQKGKKIIASLQEKMKPPRSIKDKIEEKAITDSPEEIEKEIDPGEDDYKKAQSLFESGRFVEAAILFEKTTKTRGSKYIASAYVYLGVSHLARINPANINEARKLHLKGVASFQNALRFEGGIALPSGYDKYQPVFDEAKERLR